MNPILVDLGFIQIYWYSFILFLAFFIGGILAIHEAKKWNIPEDFMINLFFYIIIFSLIGARLYYVLFNLDYYKMYPMEIIKVWQGGLAIHGGLIAALLVVLIYSKKYKVKTLRLLDILVVSLILGQAIGRWGNFMNGEAHGIETTIEHLKNLHIPDFIINGMNIDGIYYIPTFFYESILCFIGFIILFIFRKLKYTKIGQTTSLYLIWYGIVRFIIEGMRTDSLMYMNFRVAQVVSVIMVIIGLIMFIKLKAGSLFENRYNDPENVENIRF
ncbi:MAG: prolipoprotein diacylglyceryl transferase [Bacilli bacterium]|nr:prolipoprotein diacylglyceryl transferase [Bacilli bacterium]